MKLNLKKIKPGILPNSELWLCKDGLNLTGSGKTKEEALGDYILGYRELTKIAEEEYELEINLT